MIQPENRFIQSVNRKLPLKTVIHYEKMNNPYRRGTADSWYSGNKADMWIEWKYLPKLPKTIDPQKLLHPLQTAWLNGRHKEGRNVCVVIGCPDGGVILKDKLWLEKMEKEDFMNRLKSAVEIALFIKQECVREEAHDDQQDSQICSERGGDI